MTSVVDTTVKSFNSTMANAPALSGSVGSLIGVLDACLVTGFDTKTLTSLVVAGGVATASFSGTHSAQVDAVILIAGSSIAALNGEQKVTAAIGSLTVKFATAEPDGTATGTITMRMAPAGWTKVFTGTNLAVYQSSDVLSTRMLLRVDDTNATFSRVVGYEQMTDVNTGTNPFPTAVQISGGGYWPKSTTASAVAVSWSLHGDGRLMYFSPAPGYSSGVTYQLMVTYGFGDVYGYKPGGDPYACILGYSKVTTPSTMVDGGLFSGSENQTACPRAFTGVAGSSLHRKLPLAGSDTSSSGNDARFGNFPSGVDGSMILSKILLMFSLGVAPRGEFPGALHFVQGQGIETFKFLDRVPGVGAYAGRTLQAVTPASSGYSFSYTAVSVYGGVGFIDITGPWR